MMEAITKKMLWPEGKKFAFTIFDDTDFTTIHNGQPIYEFLYDMGFRTTKSVWPLKCTQKPFIGGSTCADLRYLSWVQELQKKGFEIALHNVTDHSSIREEIIKGIEQFKKYFASYPNIQVNHSDCQDIIYWGEARVTGMKKLIYSLFTRFRNYHKFQGHVEDSEFFWGDICKEKIKYVRNFVFSDINTLKMCPYMPYFDNNRPYVNNWFASSEGADVHSFTKTISEENQDRLQEEGGACIMYTHLGARFFKDGELNPRFKYLMERLSRKNGWFVPVSTLLDYIISVRGTHNISAFERYKLEIKWFLGKIKIGGNT